MINYSGVPANASLVAGAQISIPQDAVDPKAVSTVNTGLQKLADYVEAIRQIIIGSGLPINEGFEGATFPPPTPASGWTSPSARFPSDSAWLRTTSGPLTGTASASAPTPQTASTNSSMGLQVFLATPSRAQFIFAVTCNANNGDHLDFYVDGVLTAQFSSTSGPTAVAGTFYTDLLPEGLHTFDWRFVRGASASVGSEKCLVDVVQIRSEESWRTDPTLTRLYMFDEMLWGLGSNISVPATAGFGTAFNSLMVAAANHAGSVNPAGLLGFNGFGEVAFVTAATAAGDSVYTIPAFSGGDVNSFNGGSGSAFTFAKSPFAEWRVAGSPQSASLLAEIGLRTSATGGGSDFAGWAFDGGVSTTNWRWRTRTSGGTQTDIDSGFTATLGAYSRLGTIASTVGGISSVVFVKDGKALPASTTPPILTTNLPTTVTPGFQVKSLTPASVSLFVDWWRCLALR